VHQLLEALEKATLLPASQSHKRYYLSRDDNPANALSSKMTIGQVCCVVCIRVPYVYAHAQCGLGMGAQVTLLVRTATAASDIYLDV
jgi:hypothetical protein